MTEQPDIRTLDQILALTDAGEWRDEFHEAMRRLLAGIHEHSREFQADAAGSIALKVSIKCDRFGELEIDTKAKFAYPQPPEPSGRGRAHIGTDGKVTRHPQSQMTFLRDVTGDQSPARDLPTTTDRKEA